MYIIEAVLFVDMCIYECRCLLLVTYDVERRECKRVDRRRLRSIRDRTRERERESVCKRMIHPNAVISMVHSTVPMLYRLNPSLLEYYLCITYLALVSYGNA